MTDMQPEYTTPLFQAHLSSPGRKRRRDEPSTLGELELDLMATSWDASSTTPSSTFSRPFGNTQYQVHASSKPSALRIKHQHALRTYAAATAASIHKPSVLSLPRHKRSRVALSSTSPNSSFTTTTRSRSPSPMACSQEMHLSPEFAPATLSVKTASNPIKPPAIQGQRCHICSRAQLLSFASTITDCEQCDKPTCGVCARDCTSCDERVCGKCCREKGDFTFCMACYGIMERRKKA
ncbi:hypothetical protein BGX38DRAFT_1269828 [Terfezia claveryi]|nr:hypothetical protein BGX38DRAFT_1269828 [Terfezia claveryi]